MKTYIGVKIIEAMPMTRQEYNDYRGWELPADEDPKRKGHLVEYEADPDIPGNHPDHKGYISWSPEKVFEGAYRETTGLPFGHALEALKKGKAIRLPQWKDDVKILMAYPTSTSLMSASFLYVESRFGTVPWKETMIELLSEEWQIVE